MDSIPFSDLRAHLAETLRQLRDREEPVYISRRSEPVAVLMSVAQYQRLQGAQVGFGEALLAWRERHAAELATGTNEEWDDPFADVRDRSPDGGRPPVDWLEVLAPEAHAPITKARPRARRGAGL